MSTPADRTRRFARLGAAVLLTLGLAGVAQARGIQLGPPTRYSAEEIQRAVSQAPGYDPGIMGQAGWLAVNIESGGNAGIYNGSCCTGVLQVNTDNLKNVGHLVGSPMDVRRQYANMSLQEQANIWVRLTAPSIHSPPVRQLAMLGTFDGQKVDSALLLACIQLGTGHCQKTIKAGSCSAFSDSNGTSICKMANAIRKGGPSAPIPPSVFEGPDLADDDYDRNDLFGDMSPAERRALLMEYLKIKSAELQQMVHDMEVSDRRTAAIAIDLAIMANRIRLPGEPPRQPLPIEKDWKGTIPMPEDVP